MSFRVSRGVPKHFLNEGMQSIGSANCLAAEVLGYTAQSRWFP